MTIWLARHGATTAPAGLAVGASDPPLSARGRAQAAALAEALAGRPLVAVFASDLRRARATAIPAAERHGLEVEADPDLREIDFGAWEMRPLARLWQLRPAEARAWEIDLRATPSDFGESFADLERRVHRFAGRLPGGEVLVVAHRGPLALLRALLGGETVESSLAKPLAPGQVVAC